MACRYRLLPTLQITAPPALCRRTCSFHFVFGLLCGGGPFYSGDEAAATLRRCRCRCTSRLIMSRQRSDIDQASTYHPQKKNRGVEKLIEGGEVGAVLRKKGAGSRSPFPRSTKPPKGHKADLDKIGPPKPIEPEAEQFSRVAEAFGFNKQKVRAFALLVVPFIRTILFELGGLWCLGYAFRPVGRSAQLCGSRRTIRRRAGRLCPTANAGRSSGQFGRTVRRP